MTKRVHQFYNEFRQQIIEMDAEAFANGNLGEKELRAHESGKCVILAEMIGLEWEDIESFTKEKEKDVDAIMGKSDR